MMSVKQVADRLSVKEKTVYAWASSGQLPGYKLGDLWRFDPAEIEAWLADCKYKPTDTDAIARQVVAPHRPDVDKVLKKAIAEEKGMGYPSVCEKSDRVKGHKKGGSDELN
jgi:excisionase family DNA binding protein